MALPVGVQTKTLNIGRPFDALGNSATLKIQVTPFFGGTAQRLVWSATGDTFEAMTVTPPAQHEPDGDLSETIDLPIVDQAGWIDGSRNAITGWQYQVSVTPTFTVGGVKTRMKTYTKFVSPTSADSSPIDMDRLPDGTAAAPILAPGPTVTDAELNALSDTLQAALTTKADATALTALTTTVNAKASSAALGAETIRATAAEGTLTTTLDAKAALSKVAATVSASGAAVVNRHNPVNASAAARSISLPTGQAEGTHVSVEKVDSSANTVSVTGSIRGVGSSTLTLVWQYESVMFRADSAGSWWPVAGHKTKASLDSSYAQVVTPEKYGAVGDGATDDSAAVQAAFTAAGNASALSKMARVVLSQSYRIVTNLYGFGNVTFEGPGELVLDADLSASDGSKFWINLGIKSKAGTNSTWTGGRWSVNLRTTTNVTPSTGMRLINAHRASGVTFEGFTIDLTATGPCKVSGIGCYNDTSWCTSSTKTRITVRRVSVIAAQSSPVGGEGIGLGNVDGLWVLDNHIYGVGDDVIGIHTCTNFEVAGNRCWSPDGRLYFSTVQTGHVHDNRNERIAAPDGTWHSGGALMMFQIEAIGGSAPTGVNVHDNELIHGSGTVSATYGMRLRGVRRFNVHDNHIRDTSGFGYGITWEGQDTSIDAAGWSDPEGLDTDGKARTRDLRVVGNYVTGGGEGRIKEAVSFTGCTVYPVEVHSNRPGIGGTTLSTHAAYQPPSFPGGIGFPAKSSNSIPNLTLFTDSSDNTLKFKDNGGSLVPFGGNTFPALSSSGIANNTLFLDSTDNRLKFKDNDGTVVRVLLDRGSTKVTTTTVSNATSGTLWTDANIPATQLRAGMAIRLLLPYKFSCIASGGTLEIQHQINGVTIATGRLVNISQTSAIANYQGEQAVNIWVETLGASGAVSMSVNGLTRSNIGGTIITEEAQTLAASADLSAGLTYTALAVMSTANAGNTITLQRAVKTIVA